MKRRSSRLLMLPAATLLATALFTTQAFAGQKEDERATNAVRVLDEIRRIPEESIPDKLLDEAKAIVVIPDSLKAGLVFGGRRGHGLMSVKNPDGTWSQPVFIKLTGGSIGFQAGVQSADIVLVFRNDRNLDNIVNGKFTLGADAGVAAGPVGRNAAAATDGQLKAEIWSWSRARGLFAGVALDGAVMQIDDDANTSVYGSTGTPRAIFEGRAGAPSPAVVGFRDQLEEATSAARAARGGTAGSKTTSSQRAVLPTTTVTAPSAAETAPLGSQPAAAASPGFQPVAEGEVRTEQLNTTP
jgi:lipid-binding SYLF domain-containing protein